MTNLHIAIDGMLLRRPYTGVELSILHLVRELARGGAARYSLLTPSAFRDEVPGDGRLAVRRCALPTPFRLLRILWEQAALPGVLRGLGANLLHAAGYVAPLHPGVPTIVTIYDVIALRFPAWCKRANHLHYRLLLPAAARRARAVIVPSETTRRDLTDVVPGAARNVHVIPLGVDERFKPVRDPVELERVRRRMGLPGRYLLFVGQLEPKKNLARLVRAFHALKTSDGIPHRLVLAGPPGWKIAELRDAIRRLGLHDQIVTPGFVSMRDLPALYTMADLFVFPSLYEGFGIPPLEAMACGVPVACSNRGALPEVVGDAAALFDPDDDDGMIGAMRRLLTDDAERARLAEAGARRARTFTWRRHAEAVDRVYQQIAGEGRPA